MAINDKIKDLRVANGFTQEEMAEQLDISLNGYRNLEKGVSKVDWDKLIQIAQIFKIDLLQLVEAEQKGLVIQQNISFGNEVSERDNLNKNYADGSGLTSELEKKDLIIEHQQETIEHQKEMLKQKDNEISMLKEMLEMYKKQIVEK